MCVCVCVCASTHNLVHQVYTIKWMCVFQVCIKIFCVIFILPKKITALADNYMAMIVWWENNFRAPAKPQESVHKKASERRKKEIWIVIKSNLFNKNVDNEPPGLEPGTREREKNSTAAKWFFFRLHLSLFLVRSLSGSKWSTSSVMCLCVRVCVCVFACARVCVRARVRRKYSLYHSHIITLLNVNTENRVNNEAICRWKCRKWHIKKRIFTWNEIDVAYKMAMAFAVRAACERVEMSDTTSNQTKEKPEK